MNETQQRPDEGPILGSGYIFLASTIILGLGIFLAYQLFRNPLTHQTALIILGLSMIPWAIMIVRLVRLRRALGTADLWVDLASVPMGYSGTVTYVRPLRNAEVRTLEARLQCDETILKGRGKNRREVTRTVYDEVLSPQTTPMMQELQVRIPIQIPTNGPPSMDFVEAKITWWLRLRLNMIGCPNTRSSFVIDVHPAVMQR
jgi:hypothetical protein